MRRSQIPKDSFKIEQIDFDEIRDRNGAIRYYDSDHGSYSSEVDRENKILELINKRIRSSLWVIELAQDIKDIEDCENFDLSSLSYEQKRST